MLITKSLIFLSPHPTLFSNFSPSFASAYQISHFPAWIFKPPCTMTKPLPFLPYSPKSFNFPMCALTFWPQSLKVWMKSAKEGGIDSFARNQDSTSYLSLLFYIHLTVHLSPELLQPFPCGILTSISQYTVLLKRYSLSANFNQPGIRDTLHITSHTVICM